MNARTRLGCGCKIQGEGCEKGNTYIFYIFWGISAVIPDILKVLYGI